MPKPLFLQWFGVGVFEFVVANFIADGNYYIIHLNENASHYIVITVIADWRLMFSFCLAPSIGAGVRGWRFSLLLVTRFGTRFSTDNCLALGYLILIVPCKWHGGHGIVIVWSSYHSRHICCA